MVNITVVISREHEVIKAFEYQVAEELREIAEEMEDAGEEYAIKAYRVPSKNYKGKEFLTCSVE